MDSGLALASILLIASLTIGFIVSIGSHRKRSTAILSIVFGSLSLALLMYLAMLPGIEKQIVVIEPLDLELACDTVSAIVLLNVVFLGIASLIASYRYCDIVEEHGYGPYYTLMLAFLVSMALIPLVRDWLWFLFFFEIMTLASYFLIGYEYREHTVTRIAWKYFITMHILCTMPLLIAVGLVYAYVGDLNFRHASLPSIALALFLLGFATKSGLFPLHFWLPDAHPVAPTPVSALLSGAMVEMGAYGMYRVVELYGTPSPWLTTLIIAMAIASTLAAVMSYHRQDDVKRLFAWSTIDNAGWMYLAIALGMSGEVLAKYILNHGLAKAAAFLSAGLVLYVFGTRSITKLQGAFSLDRIALGTLIVSIFALEGVPPFNFFWSRFEIVREALATNLVIGVVYVLLWAIAFVSFLYIVHRLIEVKEHEENRESVTVIRSVPISMVLAIIILLALLLVSNALCTVIENLMG